VRLPIIGAFVSFAHAGVSQLWSQWLWPTSSRSSLSPPTTASRTLVIAGKSTAYAALVNVYMSFGKTDDGMNRVSGTRVMYPSGRQYAGYREPRDPDGTNAKAHPGQGLARQQGC
jgi:hypothetical protein